jgi:hypothetical protein
MLRGTDPAARGHRRTAEAPENPGAMNCGIVAGCTLGIASGWNFGNVGAIPSELARSYGVTLATVGLLTTAMS